MILRGFLFFSVFNFLAFSNCVENFQRSCQYLRENNFPIVLENSDGYLFNPLVPAQEYRDELLNRTNNQNFTLIANKFNQIKTSLIRFLESEDEGYFSQIAIRKLNEARIVVENRERCTREHRNPVVASFYKRTNEVLLCPLLTHMSPDSLVTIMVHELGHLLDPCSEMLATGQKGGSRNRIGDVTSYPFYEEFMNAYGGVGGCNLFQGEDEVFADLVSAKISSSFINPNDAPRGVPSMVWSIGFRLSTCNEANGFDIAAPILSEGTLCL